MQLAGYEFGEKIGAGGMASVYKGKQLSLLRPVAIKVLDQRLGKHSQVREAFDRESLIIARLSHPNIIHVIDRGVSETGSPYFIMEYIDGMDLTLLMREASLPFLRKVEIFLQICKALSYAHQNGVIHRDIKPGNILVDRELNVNVLDFGIAQFADDRGDSSLNGGEEQDVMGTLSYMAPELHHSVRRANEKSDIYSLGLIMYELFAGRFPSPNPLPPSTFAPEVPSALDKLILACCAPQASRRPVAVTVIHDSLLLLLRGAHLNKQQIKRAEETVNKKTFALLDVLKDTPQEAVYHFLEKASGHQLVVKKRVGREQGYATAKRMASLPHPHIARVHGVSRNERAFIVVTDYLAGGSLAERLVQPFAYGDFLVIARQLCSALAFAHRNELAHGSLRPNHVYFDQSGRVQLADFGWQDAEGEGIQSQLDQVVRKEGWYSLPEEENAMRLDVYACGVLFYLMLIGEQPRLMEGQLQRGGAFRRLPQRLQQLLVAMLQSDPNRRVITMSQVANQLNTFEDSMPTVVLAAEPVPKPDGRLKRLRQQQLLLALLVLFFLVLVNTGVVVWLDGSSFLQSLQDWLIDAVLTGLQ